MKKRILFAPASNVLFHVGRCLALARELRGRGHAVCFVGTRRYLQDAALTGGNGFEFYELPDFGAEEAMEILRRLGRRPARRFIQEAVQAEIRALKRLVPDLLVIDFRLTMYLSGKILGIPTASLLLGAWMQQYTAMKPTFPRTYPQLALLQQVIGEKATAWLAPHLLRLIVRYKMRPFCTVARHYGQPSAPLLWDLLVGDCNLLFDTELWSPTRPLPSQFHRVGPILWEPDVPLPPWVAQLDPKRPVIFINFGSTGHPDLFRTVFHSFAGTAYQVIMVTGGQIDPDAGEIPPNFRVARFLPGLQLMPHTTVVIYHGGAGTAYQIIQAGVPSIVVATHLDQEFQGLATEAHQTGVFLTMRQVLARPQLLLDALDRVLGQLPLYRDNVEKLQQDLRGYQGVRAAADCLEAYLRARQPTASE